MRALSSLHSACTGEFSSCAIMSHHPKLDQVFPQSHCTNTTLQCLWPSELASVNQGVYKKQMQNRTKISNILPCPSQKYFIETAFSLGFVKSTCKIDLSFPANGQCPHRVCFCQQCHRGYAVSGYQMLHFCFKYTKDLGQTDLFVQLLLWVHANGFITFNSFLFHSQQAQAGRLEDI